MAAPEANEQRTSYKILPLSNVMFVFSLVTTIKRFFFSFVDSSNLHSKLQNDMFFTQEKL